MIGFNEGFQQSAWLPIFFDFVVDKNEEILPEIACMSRGKSLSWHFHKI